MGSLLSKKTAGKPKGIISEDVIHRIDIMNDEADKETTPYVARRRNSLEDDQLFDDNVYGDTEDEESSGSIGIIIAVVVIAVIAVAALVILM